MGHGGGTFGTSPGSYLDIGNTFAGNSHTCMMILPDHADPSAPSSGLSQQIIVSPGNGGTPEWKYASMDNWHPSEFGSTWDEQVNMVTADTAGGVLYDSIKDELVSSYPGLSKDAIVPSVHGDYVSMSCVEAPEVRFEEIISIKCHGRLKIEHEIDPEFVFICEPDSIKAISHTTTEPALCGVKIKENKLIITFSGNIPEEVTVKLSGIRKGFANVRFEKKTEEQAYHNNNFWGQAKI